MNWKLPKRGRQVLLFLLVGSLLAMWAGARPVAANDPPNPVRELPLTVAPGEVFDVTVTFTASGDGFGARFFERAPAGWVTSIDKTWCTPEANGGVAVDGRAEYQWSNPTHSAGVEFTAVYRVEVPADAEPGSYTFEGYLECYIGGSLALTEPIGGDDQVTVQPPAEDTGQVGLKAHTGPETGCLKLIKLFDPDDTDFPYGEIQVQVTGPNDFDQTHTLKATEDWEEVMCDLDLGTYTVQELTAVPGWEVSYDPASRELTVVEGDVPGPAATMTITNTCTIIGISVAPPEIDFGEITPGATIGDSPDITVTNTGNLNIDVSAELDDDTLYSDDDDYFYTDALRLAGNQASGTTVDGLGTWTAEGLGLLDMVPDEWVDVTTALVCPAEMYPDTEYTGTLVFWAVAA